MLRAASSTAQLYLYVLHNEYDPLLLSLLTAQGSSLLVALLVALPGCFSLVWSGSGGGRPGGMANEQTVTISL